MSLRVLIVDDDQSIRLAVRALLEADGLEVVGEATDGLEAIELTADLHPDVVVMDMMMPNMDGATATRHIKRQWPAAVIIGFTSSGDIFTPTMLAAGADQALDKNDFGELAQAIRTSIQPHRGERRSP